jgi:hypothetical protein
MSIIKEANSAFLQNETRRHFLRQFGSGVGLAALGSLLQACNSSDSSVAENAKNEVANQLSQFSPKAKSVIFIHMAGSPSQLELYDYKPDLVKLSGQDCPQSFIEGKKFAFIRGTPKLLGTQANFKQNGQSGAFVSDYMPHLQGVADDITFLKAMYTDQFNHAPAQLLMHTGSARFGRPSMGSWVTYGLGSENDNLPGFIVLGSGGSVPDAGKSIWGSGFLPSIYQGVQCRSKGEPVLFLNDPEGLSKNLRKSSIDAINAINEEQYSEYKDPETLARIGQYEMAFKMQTSVPEIMDISKEPESIHKLYGTDLSVASFANNCLLARKLVEKGVRFVQLFDWGWDHHGGDENGSVNKGLQNKSKTTDQATAALLIDLKQRGLLDDTLVVWSGEFGRTPMQENREGKTMAWKGRDHHTEAFTSWMAGGGIKKGLTYGETDEIGYAGVKDRTSVYDLQATILNQMGFNHEKFTFPFQGRHFRLTDVFGKVIDKVIA